MKKVYTLFTAALGLLTLQGYSQTLTATGSNPTVGETFNYFNTSYFAPGSSGSGQTWNFSSISGTAASIPFVAVGPTPNGGSFPQANIASNNSGAYAYHNTSSTAYQAYGYDANGTVIIYANPEDQLHFPFSLGNTYNDVWNGTFVSAGYQFFREGVTTVTADGTGTLITPSGTISNVVRVHFEQNYTDSANIMGNPYVITYYNDQYVWYKDGTHFALAATYNLTTSAGAPTTGGTYLVTTVGVEENSLLSSSFEAYPNPATENVSIKFSNENYSTVDVSLINIAGQLVFTQQISNLTTGENFNSIDIKDMEKGTYFVKIQSDDAIAIRKIVIQ